MYENPNKPVFFDDSHQRWEFFTRLSAVVSVIIVGCTIGLLVSIWRVPMLHQVSLAATIVPHPERPGLRPMHATESVERGGYRLALRHNRELRLAKGRLRAQIMRDAAARQIPREAIAIGNVTTPVNAAFFVNYDKPSLDSFLNHASQITHLFPVWLTLDPDGAGIDSNQELTPPDKVGQPGWAPTNDDLAIKTADAHGIAIIPVLQNAGEDTFHTDWLHKMVSSPARRAAVIAQTLAFVRKGGYQGINIDLETDQASDRAGITAFMTQIAAAFHAQGLIVTQDIELDSTAYDIPALARINEFVIPMLYDENGDGNTAGPIAGQSWFRGELASFLAQAPPNKVVLGLGNYCYDWAAGSTTANDMSFGEAVQTAQESVDGDDGVIRTDPSSLNPTFTYYDDSQGQGDKEIEHQVWMLDATTAYNQIHAAGAGATRGVAIWRLGSEDPSLWDMLSKDGIGAAQKVDSQKLTDVAYDYFGTQFEGAGDVLQVVRPPTDGHRTITVDPSSGLITGEKFETYPSQYVIRRTGLVDQTSELNTSKTIALTFDDGPDPRWTPKILDILDRYHVPATFFVVGENAENNPGIVAREWNDGMEIGNHSFTHPEIDSISMPRLRLELDATQRVIESITGHTTTLFRAPNLADSEPSTPADLKPIIDAEKLGYLFIGEKIDPTDWTPGISADQIVGYVLKKDAGGNLVNAQQGNCILLHDAGGDTRQPTIDALPRIISGLKAAGYHFVLVSALVGKPKSQIFPPVTGRELAAVWFDRGMFAASYWTGRVFSSLFIVAIILGIGRILLMGVLAMIQKRREARRIFDPNFRPTVSVVIAAYNEAPVINMTVATLLASEYPDIEIVVVDDGSRDGTADVVRDKYGDHPRVTVLQKENGGKASALNVGIRACRGEIVVALDADTVFKPDTIGKLVRHFADPSIGAVSGNVKVGNRVNAWTIWQAVEYITSQNFDRRAYDLLNGITVVPGAVGAWRKDAVVLAGMFSSTTLAEDTDLTFKVRRLGYRIVTDNTALAYTEAPDSLRSLAKQRFRWAFGTLQCLFKHREVLFNREFGAFGWVSVPSLWIYQIAFQVIAPIVDLTIVWALFYTQFITANGGREDMIQLAAYWGLFSLVELVGAALAFALDKEDKRLLGWVILQRFVYRQMMYYVVIKSVLAAVRGRMVGWGKLERKGTVSTPVLPAAEPKILSPALRAGPPRSGKG